MDSRINSFPEDPWEARRNDRTSEADTGGYGQVGQDLRNRGRLNLPGVS